MSCGCQTSCGCILAPGEYVTVVESPSGTFTISALPPVKTISDTPCVDLTLDDDGDLSASLVLSAEEGAVELECTEDGLAATLIIDPASTADVSVGPDGLLINEPAAPVEVAGYAPGDLLFHGGIGVRVGFDDADGGALSRTGFSGLWDALSLLDTAGARTLGSDVIYDLTSTKFVRAGDPVEASGFAGPMTVVSVDSGTQITVSDVALDTGVDTEVRVYPHGNGDGAFTFNKPDMSRRLPLGYDYASGGENIGTLQGSEDVTLGVNDLPPHDHTASASTSISGSGTVPTSTDGIHNHVPNGGRSFVTVDNPQHNVSFANNTPDDITIPVSTASDTQSNNAATGDDGSHDHTTAGTAIAAALAGATSVTVDDNSTTNDPVDVMNPYMVGRWLVKT